MGNIQITKVDESSIKINAEASVTEELSEFFTFMAPDYKFNPLFRARKWDGKIRLYNRRTKKLHAGLYRYLEQFAKDRKYTLSGDLYVAENHSLKESEEFIASLSLSAHGTAIEARDYQILAVTKALRYRNCVLVSATSSGKSAIIYSLARFLLQNKCKKGLLIVPTVGLVEQMYKDFQDYSTINKWSVEENCQKIYANQVKWITKDLVISTWQSLKEIYDVNPNFLNQFDFVIGDEAHHFQAKCLGNIMAGLVNAKYRIGTTGTLQDSKVHKLVIEGYFGPAVSIITAKELMDRKEAAELTIKCLILKYSKEEAKANKLKKDYHEEMDFLCAHKLRNNFISNLALSLKNNTLVLFQYVEKHGKPLYEEIARKNKNPNRKIFYVSGEVDVEIREQIRELTETESDAIIVASNVFSTGTNIRNLHNIIFASPSKAKIRNLQSIGRGLRMTDTKTTVTLFDIVDDLRLDNHINYTMNHYAERVKLYHSEKFTVKTYNIGLHNG